MSPTTIDNEKFNSNAYQFLSPAEQKKYNVGNPDLGFYAVWIPNQGIVAYFKSKEAADHCLAEHIMHSIRR